MEFSEIKTHLPILEVLRHYNLSPDRNNRLKCPFHDDKTPSFQVYPKTGTWTCFSGNCPAGSGDQVDFIMKYEGITKHQAILKAKELLGYTSKSSDEIPSSQKKYLPVLTPQDHQQILTESFTHFVRSLGAKPKKAMEYLESRKLDHKVLSIGYDAGTLHKRKEVTDKKKQQYLQAGLLKPDKFGRENSFYTRFNGCIVFPLLDKQGNISSLYGRHTEKGHHYLEGEHRGLYPGYPDPETKRLILTEAIIDAATMQQLPEITKEYTILALYGTNGFTEKHTEAVSQLKGLKEVILFFDGDDAGNEAIESIAGKLKQINKNLSITFVETPEGGDVNSLLQGHDPEIFTHLLETRRYFSFSTESHFENQNRKSSIEKEKSQDSSLGYLTRNPVLKVTADYMRYETAQLEITLWGGIDTNTVSRLRATLHVQLKDNGYVSFRDTADLYSHSQTDRLIKQAAEKLEVSTLVVSHAITGLTKELEQYRQQRREEKRQNEQKQELQSIDRFNQEQMQKAREFLRSSDLTKRTHELFNNLGMVDQGDNATLLFFIFLTRLFKNPLHAIVMGSSGSGKTHLLQGVAGTTPKQHINVTTSLSENTLYYTPKDFLKHKILLQEDLDGAYHALLPLRELMSNQEISRFSTRTNSRTGESKQVYLHVEGPVCVAGATTRERVYEDNANRSFLLQIREDPHHERQVLEYQGKVAAGLVNVKQYEKNINLLKACQLLLEPMEVVIPFAPKLELPPHVFKKMRTKNHYLTLIKAITLWNQKQRKLIKDNDGNTVLVSTIEDVRWANTLSRESLLRKSDELSGKTRSFFESLKELIRQWNAKTFYAKDVRKYLRMHPMTLQRHVDELERRGLLRCVSRSNKPGNEYEVAVWDDFEELKSGLDIMDIVLKKLENEQPSHNLHTTFTKGNVKVESK
jgi:DNA primase catalytic core